MIVGIIKVRPCYFFFKMRLFRKQIHTIRQQVEGHLNPWGGLGLCTGQGKAFICDTPTTGHWYMCVGCQSTWRTPGEIPGPYDYTTTKVELYVQSTGYNLLSIALKRN